MLSKKGLRDGLKDDSCREDSAMMGRKQREQASLFYEFPGDIYRLTRARIMRTRKAVNATAKRPPFSHSGLCFLARHDMEVSWSIDQTYVKVAAETGKRSLK
jgi:hypothetical protein